MDDKKNIPALNIDPGLPGGGTHGEEHVPHWIYVVLIAVFVGFALTLGADFGVSAFTEPSGLTPDYYDGKEHHGIILKGFSDRFYRSRTARETITKLDFLLFGKLPGEDVILGKQGFLFEIRSDEDYDYIADYIGDYDPVDAEGTPELLRIADAMEREREKYLSHGVECVFAVIPNSQTVYDRMMPDFFGEISSSTRLCRLTEEMTARGLNGSAYTDLTGVLKSGARAGYVCNTTENSLNSRGAYEVCRRILDLLPESSLGPGPILPEKPEFVSRLTEGKELARRLGLGQLIPNVTVSLSTETPQRYSVTDIVGALQVTRADDPLDPNGKAVLFKFSSDWDRVIMTDFLSGALACAGYTSNLKFDAAEMELLSPSAVVIFLHENELSVLIRDGE